HALGDGGGAELSELEPVGDVGADGHVGPERVVLEHHADVALVRPERVDLAGAEPDLAVIQRVEAGHQPEQGGLSATPRPEPRGKLAATDLEARAVDGRHAPEALADLLKPDLQGFFQVASMSVRNFCLSPSDRFCADASSYTFETSRSKYERTPPVNSTAISAGEPGAPCTLYFGVIGKRPRSMNTRCPPSLRGNSMNARAALGLRAPARMAIGSGVTNAFFGATNLRSKPASFSSKAMYEGTANPAANSPLATTVGTSRLRAVKSPVLPASFLSQSQPLSSPCTDRITSYVAFDDDDRVGAHCPPAPLSLGFRRSSHSLGSAMPSRWIFLG